ncbi:MAG: 50S ribosomal protein P1 [Candidatus Freyarchaeota archaeon]|nr:50S ribosomal protein P1 [Candidatus Jordarchaeia archaeon]
MEYVYAAMLLHRAGKGINEENIKKVLSAAGISPDEVRVKALVAALEEVNIDEAIKSAAPMSMAAVAVPPQAEVAAGKEEEKKEEEKEEKEEVLEGLGALFG